MSTSCPICSSSKTKLVQDKIKGDVTTKVMRCIECDLDFLETWDDAEHVKSLYEGDNYVFTHNVSEDTSVALKYDEYKVRYDWVKPSLSKSSTLLEIGCGDGKFLNMVRNDVELAEGVELSPPQVKKVRSDGLTCYDLMIDDMPAPRRYDIVCMFALLEHVPNVTVFLEKLKDYVHEDSHIFIEVPNLNDPLVNGYDVPEYRNFYYRPVHLYYFTPTSLGKLLDKAGYTYNLHTTQQTSITNHFHWMHNRCGQADGNSMSSIVTPENMLKKLPIKSILEKVDDYYRELLIKNEMGDLLAAHVQLKSETKK